MRLYAAKAFIAQRPSTKAPAGSPQPVPCFWVGARDIKAYYESTISGQTFYVLKHVNVRAEYLRQQDSALATSGTYSVSAPASDPTAYAHVMRADGDAWEFVQDASGEWKIASFRPQVDGPGKGCHPGRPMRAGQNGG